MVGFGGDLSRFLMESGYETRSEDDRGQFSLGTVLSFGVPNGSTRFYDSPWVFRNPTAGGEVSLKYLRKRPGRRSLFGVSFSASGEAEITSIRHRDRQCRLGFQCGMDFD